MANSLITRCPKCSTAFRVSDDVLSMAKGKVRCGQCFHIFNASDTISNKAKVEPSTSSPASLAPQTGKVSTQTSNVGIQEEKRLPPTEEIVNPDWLDTLFNDKDLNPFDENSVLTPLDPYQDETPASKRTDQETNQ